MLKTALNDITDTKTAVNPQSITSGAAVNGATIDTLGWDGVEFVINMGAFTGSGALDAYVQSGANSNASDMANIANAALAQVAAANNNNVAVIDVYRPTNRYVRLVLLQSVNTVVAGGTAILYRRNGLLPPTKSAQQTVKIAQN
jgi:hypothetical protein